MLAAEVYVEGDQLADQRTSATASVLDGINSWLKVCARCMEGYRYWCSPPIEQRLQVVEESVVSVRRVGDAFPAVHEHIHWHVIVENPVITSLGYSGLHGLFSARYCFFK